MEKIPLSRHPNPYFERKRYFSLNGEWDFIIDKQAGFPSSYNEKILVHIGFRMYAMACQGAVC